MEGPGCFWLSPRVRTKDTWAPGRRGFLGMLHWLETPVFLLLPVVGTVSRDSSVTVLGPPGWGEARPPGRGCTGHFSRWRTGKAWCHEAG